MTRRLQPEDGREESFRRSGHLHATTVLLPSMKMRTRSSLTSGSRLRARKKVSSHALTGYSSNLELNRFRVSNAPGVPSYLIIGTDCPVGCRLSDYYHWTDCSARPNDMGT